LAGNPLIFFAPENLPFGPVAQLNKEVSIMKEFLNKLIDERKAQKGKKDILASFIQASEAADQGLTHQEIVSNTFILFLAGHETTATALMYLLYELSIHQDIQDKLYQEIVDVIGEKKEADFEHMDKLPYLDMVISENLRVHPPATLLITRKATQDLKYKDKVIPKECLIGVDIHAIHHNPDVHKNPEEFIPERFTPENKKAMDRFAYLPFSLGPRQCIGNNFSLMEQHLFIIEFLQKFTVLPPKHHVNEWKRDSGFPSPTALHLRIVSRK